MSIVSRRAAPLFAASLLLIAVIAPIGSQPRVRATDPTVNGAIAEQQKMEAELARQRTQLAELQRSQADLTASLSGINADLASVGLDIEQLTAEIEQAAHALEEARAELARHQIDIGSLERTLAEIAVGIDLSKAELADREALLQEHLRTAYEQSQTSILEVILSTDSFTRASSQLSYMLTLSDEDRRLAIDIRNRRSMLETRRETFSVGRGTLTQLRDAAARRADALAEQQKALDAARAALEEHKAQLEKLRDAQDQQLAVVGQSAEAQQQQIAIAEQELAAQQALVETLKAAALQLDVAYRGRFDWPERGRFIVTQEFGLTSYNTFHTGLDMAYLSGCGGPIYAAGDGIVLADGRPNAEFGDSAIGVLIGHSQRLATMYWHLSREVVTVGQRVSVGDIIGYEGATGIATGCHLHFEVRFDGVAVNPRIYLP